MGRPKAKGEERKDDSEVVLHTPWIDKLPMTEYENKEQRCDAPSSLQKLADLLFGACKRRLHDEIVAFIQYVQPTPEETSAREKVVKRLTELIQRRFWNCEVKIFGSVAQGLSLPGG